MVQKRSAGCDDKVRALRAKCIVYLSRMFALGFSWKKEHALRFSALTAIMEGRSCFVFYYVLGK